jgi:predicted nucleic acid-binding protein
MTKIFRRVIQRTVKSAAKPWASARSAERASVQPAGILRESVLLSGASWCQLQRAPLGTDAWLAALALSLDYEITTFDRGFKSFRGLKLRLLEMPDR